MNAVGLRGQGHIETVIDDQGYAPVRQQFLDRPGLRNEGPGGKILLPDLDAGGAAVHRRRDDLLQGPPPAQIPVRNQIQAPHRPKAPERSI